MIFIGEITIGSILQILDEAFPEGRAVSDLRTSFNVTNRNPAALGRKRFDNIIKIMILDRIVAVDANFNEQDFDAFVNNPDHRQLSDTIFCTINSKGFELLNQIRIKQALETLDASIDTFDNSSRKSFGELNEAIKDFKESSNKSSNWLIILTIVIAMATAIQVFIALKWF